MKTLNNLSYRYEATDHAHAICKDCNVLISKATFDKYGEGLCDKCNVGRAKVQRKEAFVELFRMVIVYVIASVGMAYLFNTHFMVGGESLLADSIIGAVLGLGAVCLVAGWRELSRFNLRAFGIFIIIPFIGWIIYACVFCLKVAISLVIGVVAAPYRIIKNIITINKMNRIERYVLGN